MKIKLQNICILYFFLILFIRCTNEKDKIDIISFEDDNYEIVLENQIVNVGLDSNKNLLYVIIEEKNNRNNHNSFFFNDKAELETVYYLRENQKPIKHEYYNGYLDEIIEYKDFDSGLINQVISVYSIVDTAQSNLLYIQKKQQDLFTFDLFTYYDYDSAYAFIGKLDQNNLYKLIEVEDTIYFKSGQSSIEYPKDTIQGILWYGKIFDDHTEYYTLQFKYPYSKEIYKALYY